MRALKLMRHLFILFIVSILAANATATSPSTSSNVEPLLQPGRTGTTTAYPFWYYDESTTKSIEFNRRILISPSYRVSVVSNSADKRTPKSDNDKISKSELEHEAPRPKSLLDSRKPGLSSRADQKNKDLDMRGSTKSTVFDRENEEKSQTIDITSVNVSTPLPEEVSSGSSLDTYISTTEDYDTETSTLVSSTQGNTIPLPPTYKLLVTEILDTQHEVTNLANDDSQIFTKDTNLPGSHASNNSSTDPSTLADELVESNASVTTESRTELKSLDVNLEKAEFGLKIRKCCEELEYFSLVTLSCESIDKNEIFHQLTQTLFHESAVGEISLSSSALKCPGDQSPQTTPGVTNNTHVVIEGGTVYELRSGHVYNHTEYCLELVGRDFNNSLLTLAYCEKESLDYYYDTHYPDTLGQDYEPEEVLDTYHLTVRKCCQELEYYNAQQHKCVALEDPSTFHTAVKQISFGSENVGLNIISSRLRQCPNQIDLPTIHTLDSSVFRLRFNGDLIDTATGLQYDYSYYCMEHIGNSPETMVLNIALCNKANYLLPKCCPSGQYFDEDELNCLPIPPVHSEGKQLLLEYKLDNHTYALEELNYFLPCQNALPAKESSENLNFRDGRMCLKESCYSRKDFCIDYVGDATLQQLQPIAYYCRKNFFVKCCDQDQILHEDGCADYSSGKSLLLKQLTRTRSIVRFFNYKQCRNERALLLEDSFTNYIQWWLGDAGTHLIVESSTEVKEIDNYCIDDFKDANGKVSPSAYVCESDVENMIPVEKSQRIFKQKGSLGKCCPKSPDDGSMYFFSSVHGDCQIISTNETMNLLHYFNGTGYTQQHFHDFPKCSNEGIGYHSYPLTSAGDHAQLTTDGSLKIISMAGQCVQQEQLVVDRDFCFEYIMTADGTLEPSAVVCAYTSVLDIYHEKFSLVTALLGISCVCLFATLVSLSTTRVRRGLVSTRKVNTLAGRILVSFVGSHLIGYLALALMQQDNWLNKVTSPGCYILAALIQFFNLAAFCWNTSICLESLLLTIHISISELLRYFLHSLWAWGFPAVMTLLMLLMDAYKDDLPCGTITPNIGVHHCFHSDTNARLLYFYVPIFVTLTSNVLFLVGAKALRNSRLKRLEKGKLKAGGWRRKNGTTQSVHPAPVQSGMRTHQSQNTKAESLRLVLWTGGTWFLELAGFVITKYIIPHREERWFDYLWYIPTSLNALRGVGIFAILVLTPENRGRITNATVQFRNRVSSKFRQMKPDADQNGKAFPGNGRQSTYTRDNRRRNMSITTMISNISYFRNSSVSGKTKNNPTPETATNHAHKIAMVRSVSQNGRKSSISSIGSINEDEDFDMDSKKRRCSIPLNNMHLPKLSEEEPLPEKELDEDEENNMSSSDV